jgi:superfamily II RNA helicase
VSAPPRLSARLPPHPLRDEGEVLGSFLGWVADSGLTPYPEQEEAILELFAGRHVVLSTPTGSGKSLVALALHWKALCEGERSFYTAPVKALVSEKFFALCEELGPDRVGMLTGDASVNRDAPVLCATTEVLSNMALRQGDATDAPYVVLDEFHYYDDPERGCAWQIPLLALPHSQFLLLSATLGNTAPIEERLAARTGRDVSHVHSDVRPVPLAFEYRETPLLETLEELNRQGRTPAYVVSFTQRECADLAQGLTSAKLATREERDAVLRAIGTSRLDTAYGRDLRRFLGHGLGVHHAGLLPRYRLQVEKLAQQGLLKVILGTDTLGVGVNVPIRSVVFTRLSKYDGEKQRLLSVREFLQIAGRAGRKGFDEQGYVVCQAPEHVIENRRMEARSEGKKRRGVRKHPPQGFVPWNEDTFGRLRTQPPEMLHSRFDVTHGMIVALLQRESGTRGGTPWRAVISLIERSHETPASRARLRRRAAQIFRSLRQAGVVELVGKAPPGVRVRSDLQTDFSLHESLSLYLVEALGALDPEAPQHALEVLSLVEAIQEDPRVILLEQRRKARGQLIAKLKAEGVDYDERRQRAEEVGYPKPEEAFLEESFRIFREAHPWVGEESVRPKSIAREMFEGLMSFGDYVKEYGLARSEGVLLRYLSQVHNTLARSVPEVAKTEEVYDAQAWLRAILVRVDSSLVEAWEMLLTPADATAPGPQAAEHVPVDLAANERALRARARQELLALVLALARGDYEEAVGYARPDPDEPWDAVRLEQALAPFLEEYGHVLVTPEARKAHHTRFERTQPRCWKVTQVILDPAGDHLWAVHGEVDLRDERDPEGPLVRLVRIGP